ncbi:MAG: DUF4419 domain-containing protein [Bacteroidota bacterium]
MITTKTENSITFHIETLERPEQLLDEKVWSEIAQKFADKIEYIPNLDDKLVDGGYHAFLYGLYLAYSQHRPFTLSPDMIWLLILQGISNHVNYANASGKNLFPQLSKGNTITIRNDNIILGNPTSPWHETTEEFSQEIEQILGTELVGELRADFSTTTSASKVVSEIVMMDTFKAYFEYEVAVCVCGIPEMTVEGTTSDWNHLLEKLAVLKKYDLAWWHETLHPIITNIRNTAQGIIDNEFWMHIFKIHTIEEYGNPKYIDGWITKFFPYNRHGEQLYLNEIRGLDVDTIFKELPKQIATVDVKHVLYNLDGTILEETPLEYWGGFTGISQNKETQCLRPEINWFVSHKATNLEKYIDREIENHEFYRPSRIYHNLVEIPEEVFEKPKWSSLGLNFRGKVIIPERIKELEIGWLTVNGKIDKETIERLTSYFDIEKTVMYINKKFWMKRKKFPLIMKKD